MLAGLRGSRLFEYLRLNHVVPSVCLSVWLFIHYPLLSFSLFPPSFSFASLSFISFCVPPPYSSPSTFLVRKSAAHLHLCRRQIPAHMHLCTRQILVRNSLPYLVRQSVFYTDAYVRGKLSRGTTANPKPYLNPKPCKP